MGQDRDQDVRVYKGSPCCEGSSPCHGDCSRHCYHEGTAAMLMCGCWGLRASALCGALRAKWQETYVVHSSINRVSVRRHCQEHH